MARRYHRRRKQGTDTVGALALVVVAAAIAAYQKLSSQTLALLIASVVLVLFATVGGLLLLHFRRYAHEKRKLQALTVADIQTMDGLVFEKYVVELLKNQGYGQVTLTEHYDLGVDIIATKAGVRWGIQVKRYSGMVMADAVRAVVAGLNHYKCQRAMVVTNSTFSQPAKAIAASNNCVMIDKDVLAEWIIKFQAISH